LSDQTFLLTAEDPAWDAWIERAPRDVYHRAAYHQLSESAGEGRAFMVVHGAPDRFLAWPYRVGLDDAAFLDEAWGAFRSVWADQDLVAIFTRFHPLLMNDGHCAAFRNGPRVAGGEVLHLGRTVAIDLARDRDTRRAIYPQVLRQEIKRAERAGLTVEEDPGWRLLPEFGALYRLTMVRNAASGGYMFSDRYLDALRRAWGDSAHLAVARIDDAPAAIMLFTVAGAIAQAHLTGIDPAFARLSPLKALIDGVADIAAEKGASWLHLGAGRGGFEDSLFAFKARFSPKRHDFRVGRWILNPARYQALLADGADATDGGFFPAYRAAGGPRQ
jgi:hypothetical protein